MPLQTRALRSRRGEESVDMCQAILDIRQEGVDEGVLQGRREVAVAVLAGLVPDGVLTSTDAAERAGLSPEEFCTQAAAL